MDQYLLIANQLRDIHHNLDEKIKNSPKKRPEWTVNEKNITEEIHPLLILANLLEKLGGQSYSMENRLSDIEKVLAASLGDHK